MKSAIFTFAKPERRAFASSFFVGWMGPSFCASASAISVAYFGTTMALALMHERPPLSLIAPAITSMYSRQFSMQSSPMRILLQPGPCNWIAGLFAYCAIVFLSPKMSARPQLFKISPAPSWSVG